MGTYGSCSSLGAVSATWHGSVDRSCLRSQPNATGLAIGGRQSTGRAVVGARRQSTLSLAEIRHLGIVVPWAEARVRLYTAGRAASMPAEIELTEELLWLFGVWVAEGSYHRSIKDAFLTVSGDELLLRKASKVFERDPRPTRCAAGKLTGASRLDLRPRPAVGPSVGPSRFRGQPEANPRLDPGIAAQPVEMVPRGLSRRRWSPFRVEVR